jgi:ATP-dependent Lon protease
VGGVREKALAALRLGIHTIILPKASMRDVEDIPKDLRKKLEFLPVTHMREVLDHALVEPLRWRGLPSNIGRAPHVTSAAVAKKR